ncbi:MAG: methyltransferase domain-containing protein [Cyclobacteriaceae bacterium]
MTASHDLSLLNRSLRKEETRELNISQINYDITDYLLYEFAKGGDRAKKLLEQNKLEYRLHSFIDQWNDDELPISLDIGCATCRYPKLFKEMGFVAHGYEVNERLVNFHQRENYNANNIQVQLKNILTSQPEREKFHFITCMMGTINHFSSAEVDIAFRWMVNSLKPGGHLVFSVWNPECPFQSFLSFYDQHNMNSISRNALSSKVILGKLKQYRFQNIVVEPICLLPSSCYQYWGANVDPMDLVNIDNEIAKIVHAETNSQMLVFFMTKSE